MAAPCSVPETKSEPTVGSFLARFHDRSMAQCDCVLGPVMDPDATFLLRWGALRFVSEQLQERCRQEEKLVDELRARLSPGMRDRIRQLGEDVDRLRQAVERLARGRCTARELADAAQDLIQGLRLWFAEIEFGLGDVCLSEISPCANQILIQLNYRPALQP